MIFTSSLIDGFKIILGPYAIHISLLLTMIVKIRIPENISGTKDKTAVHAYIKLLGMHVFVLVVSWLNDYTKR